MDYNWFSAILKNHVQHRITDNLPRIINHISKINSEIRIDELHYVLQKMVLQKKH